MKNSLSFELCDKYVKVVDCLFEDKLKAAKFKNIGLFKGMIIFVKNNKFNKNIIHILINNIEYAIRVEDAKKVIVEILNDSSSMQFYQK